MKIVLVIIAATLMLPTLLLIGIAFGPAALVILALIGTALLVVSVERAIVGRAH